MIFAPIIIPTLCRYEHFNKCIESLIRNSYASKTDIYVALDYPTTKKHLDGYNKIKDYLSSNSFDMFASFNVIIREKNYGAYLNEKKLIYEEIMPKYDAWIRTDDDIIFSPNFIEYIDKCLTMYENEEDIIAVAGYSYPCDYLSGNATVVKQRVYAPMWGTGFWKKKYNTISKLIEDDLYLYRNFDDNVRKKKYKNLINARLLDFVYLGLSWKPQPLLCCMTDVAISTFSGLEQKYIVIPTISKVKNNGFDGSGINCQTDFYYNFGNQVIDECDSFEIIDNNINPKIIENKINQFDFRRKVDVMKAKLKLCVYKLIGKKMYKKLWHLINGKKE